MTKTIAHELVDYSIMANNLLTVATWPEMIKPMYTEVGQKALKENIPMKEIGKPEYIARAALFLDSRKLYAIKKEVLGKKEF